MWVYFDVILLAQLAEVMELRESAAPNPERANAIRELQHIRNLVAHGEPLDIGGAQNAMTSVLGHLLQLERSSLGTAGARRLRRRTSPQTIHEILNRAETGPDVAGSE
jgi:hypothetical protein